MTLFARRWSIDEEFDLKMKAAGGTDQASRICRSVELYTHMLD